MANNDNYTSGYLKGILSEPVSLTGYLNNVTLRGIPVELSIEGTMLRWKYLDEDAWTDLIDLSTIDYETLTNLPIDATLKNTGESADAKATGDAIAEVNQSLSQTATAIRQEFDTADNQLAQEMTQALEELSGTIPTKTSELTNDSDYTTKGYVDDEISGVESAIPTKTSELTNDSDYTTKQYVDGELDTLEASIPTKVSQLQNDSSYVTTTQLTNGLATKEDALQYGTATAENVGKAMMPKTVESGKVTSWEFGEAGKVDDVQINGTSILENKVANVPIASTDKLGVVLANPIYGISVSGFNGDTYINKADLKLIKEGSNIYRPIVPYNQHESAFYGLANAAGDTTQSSSSNAVGTYTDQAKTAIQSMLGVNEFDFSDRIAKGVDNDGNIVNGAVVEGNIQNNKAFGVNSHAEGNGTEASGVNSHAEGSGTTASGGNSHAEGGGTTASGDFSHAEGKTDTNFSKTINNQTYTQAGAYGEVSHSEGQDALAIGFASHAEGNGTTASDTASHAEGNGTTASGIHSHAEGSGTKANHKSQHVFGEFNIEDPSKNNFFDRGNYVEIVGNGTYNARSNARTLDWSGNEILAGKLTVGANPTNTMDVSTKGYVDTAVSQCMGVADIDATLSTAGKPADAKKVGDEISDIKADLTQIKDVFEPCYNLFDPAAKVVGLLRANNGVIDASYTEYMASDYIPVNTGDSVRAQYDVNGVRKDSGIDATLSFYSIAFYDSTKTFIVDSGGNGVRVAIAPQNAKYFRFSLKNNKYDSVSNLVILVSTKSTILPFIAYDGIGDLKEDKIPESYDERINDIVEDAINNHDFKIAPKQTTFFHVSKNLINPEARITGEFVNQSSGVFEINSGHTRTDYLLVDENTTYVLRTENGSAGFRYFFYDVNKNPITNSGALMPSTNNMLVTSPNGAAYIVMSLNTGVSPWMLAKYVDGNTVFESYDLAYIYPEYIPDSKIEFLNLPNKIYAVAGYELNIYLENITANWEDYSWEISCEKGRQFERGYTIIPTNADEGSYTLTIRGISKTNYMHLIEKSITLIVTASTAGTGSSKSLIVLGDSTTNNGTVITKLHENFNEDSMNITTLGTRGTAPYNMEGRAGWALQDYFTRASAGEVQNPFYNPSTQTFDASYYFSETGIAKPDWFFVNMGINDMFNMKTDQTAEATAELCITYIEQIIASVKTTSPSTKLGICITIPPNHSQDAFGKAYPNRQWRNRYKRNNLILVKKIIETFSDRESADVFLIPIHTNLDTVYNMGLETLQVNSRNAITYESPILNGGVHPAESGYWQIADVYTAFLKANV